MAVLRGHRLAALAGAALLAGCSSMLGTPPASRDRPVDYLRDDIAGMVLAFDVPRGLEPLEQGSVLRFYLTALSGAYRHVRATLVRADASDLASSLPPPAPGRTYYLFAFDQADQLALRDAQAWARGLPQGYIGKDGLEVTVEPRFCAAEPVDPRDVRYSVLLAMPDGLARLQPLVSGQSLAEALGARPLPACAGHSG